MKPITINFVDFWGGFSYKEHQIYQILNSLYDVQISPKPQYLFYGPYGNSNLKFMDGVRIFVTAENLAPDFNLCDYALGFDYLEFGDRYLRRPNYFGKQAELALCMNKHNMPFESREDFCSFVVSNGHADPKREEFFYKLFEYKKINSGGRYLNNIDLPDGVPDKLEFQRKHKFAIAFENCSHPGYTTEKIVEAFAAGCIPIYWGDPLVETVFNPKAFINVGRFTSFDAAIKEIKRIDQDDNAYRAMLAEPAVLNHEYYPDVMEQKLERFLRNVIDAPSEDAKRRPQGTYMDMYLKQRKCLIRVDCFRRFREYKHGFGVKVRKLLKPRNA